MKEALHYFEKGAACYLAGREECLQVALHGERLYTVRGGLRYVTQHDAVDILNGVAWLVIACIVLRIR